MQNLLAYDTVSVLEELGYSNAAIAELEASNQIHCFKGEVPASLDEVSLVQIANSDSRHKWLTVVF